MAVRLTFLGATSSTFTHDTFVNVTASFHDLISAAQKSSRQHWSSHDAATRTGSIGVVAGGADVSVFGKVTLVVFPDGGLDVYADEHLTATTTDALSTEDAYKAMHAVCQLYMDKYAANQEQSKGANLDVGFHT